MKYTQTLSAQDRRDSSKLVRAPPPRICLRTLKSSTRVLMLFNKVIPRLFTQLGRIECCLRHRIPKVHSPICRWGPGLMVPPNFCPFNLAYTLLRKSPPKVLQPPTSSYVPYLFQCLKQTNKIPRRGTSCVCFLQFSVAVVKSTDRYCR